MNEVVNKIEIGRRVRYHGPYWNDHDGLIVAIHGNPGEHADRVVGPMTVVNPKGCTFDVITFDGVMHHACRESCIGSPGIGRIDLLNRVHGAAMIERAHQLVADKIAADALAAQVERVNHEAFEAARVIVDPPLFYWNGIKDAKGEKLQRAHYSGGFYCHLPDGTITIYARDYDSFSAKVRACFQVDNDTDTQTDYFDSDRIRVLPGHPLYGQVKAAMDACSAHYEKRAGGTK